MFQIDLKCRKPIYEQVVDNFRRLIISGVLKPDDRAPSVRDMAKALTCNPNTIQKAFRELETRGYFYTVPGQGSFISEPPAEGLDTKTERLFHELEEIVCELEFLGISRKAVAERITKRELTT
ncbi:MAG: GntR family transcriptional regulator [Defluviitaleaceae bacterium]|nr:GntR family transcriptional regulator [Defluviitaleaceae bacterium]